MQVPGRYTWADGATVTYTSWAAGAPTSTSGGCVFLARSKENDWMDGSCEAAYGAVCKITRGMLWCYYFVIYESY